MKGIEHGWSRRRRVGIALVLVVIALVAGFAVRLTLLPRGSELMRGRSGVWKTGAKGSGARLTEDLAAMTEVISVRRTTEGDDIEHGLVV